MWSRTSGKILTSPFCGHTECAYSTAYSLNGTHIISIDDHDDTARVWNISTGACIFMCPGSTAAFLPNVAHIPIAFKTTIQLWNVLDLSPESPCSTMFEAPPEMGVVESLVYSPDGRLLVLGDVVLIWDILSKHCNPYSDWTLKQGSVLSRWQTFHID